MAKEKQTVSVEDGGVYILQTGTPIYLKTADVCALTGKSNQWIGQLTSQGIINKVSTKHGAMYRLCDTLKAYCSMLESRSEVKDNDLEEEKLKADIAIKKSKAVVSALEARELQGKMHRSEDVSALTEDLVYTIRSALISLPGRIAVDVCGATTPAEASEIIRAEVNILLEQLSRYKYDPVKYEERVRERQKWDVREREKLDDE